LPLLLIYFIYSKCGISVSVEFFIPVHDRAEATRTTNAHSLVINTEFNAETLSLIEAKCSRTEGQPISMCHHRNSRIENFRKCSPTFSTIETFAAKTIYARGNSFYRVSYEHISHTRHKHCSIHWGMVCAGDAHRDARRHADICIS